MKRGCKSGLPADLLRDVNRAAYAMAQARFVKERAQLVTLALDMLDAGSTQAQVSAAMLERERDPSNPRFAY